MNKKIEKLYDDNYYTGQLPLRTFRNPFFIPSENQLLFDILNSKTKTKDIRLQTLLPAVMKTTLFTQPVGDIPPTVPETELPIQDETAEGDAEFDIDTRDVVSMESDYYQAEVYLPLDERVPYNIGDVIDSQLSDARHLVAYNKKTDTLFIAHRGTASILDLVIDVAITRRDGVGADRIDFSKTQFDPIIQGEKAEINYHVNILEKAIKQYGNKVKLELSGHSKGSVSVQMLLNYLDGNYKGKPSKIKLENEPKAYTYNAAPYEWRGEMNDPRMYPRRVSGDPISFPFGRSHPNLITIDTDGKGKKIGLLNKHDANNFVDQVMSPDKIDLEVPVLEKITLTKKQESSMIITNMLENIDSQDYKDNIKYFKEQKEGLQKVRKLIKKYGYDGYTIAEVDNDISNWNDIIKKSTKNKKQPTDEL